MCRLPLPWTRFADIRVDSMPRWVAVDQNRFSLRQRIELVTSDHGAVGPGAAWGYTTTGKSFRT
jgi:hypothetical protein